MSSFDKKSSGELEQKATVELISALFMRDFKKAEECIKANADITHPAVTKAVDDLVITYNMKPMEEATEATEAAEVVSQLIQAGFDVKPFKNAEKYHPFVFPQFIMDAIDKSGVEIDVMAKPEKPRDRPTPYRPTP